MNGSEGEKAVCDPMLLEVNEVSEESMLFTPDLTGMSERSELEKTITDAVTDWCMRSCLIGALAGFMY